MDKQNKIVIYKIKDNQTEITVQFEQPLADNDAHIFEKVNH